jgi:hypothetical protein
MALRESDHHAAEKARGHSNQNTRGLASRAGRERVWSSPLSALAALKQGRRAARGIDDRQVENGPSRHCRLRL